MKPAQRVLGVVARLVPQERRAEWLREWEAELAYGSSVSARPTARVAGILGAALEDAWGVRAHSFAATAMGARIAVRSLARAPVFTAVVVATLGIGVGANAAIFSAVQAVLLRPLPYDPSRLAVVDLAFGEGESRRSIPASGPEFLELRAENDAFSALAGYVVSDVNVGGAGDPSRVTAAAVTADLLDVLGVETLHGRGFASGEDLPGAPPVAILGHGLWTRMFGGRPEAVGAEVEVNGVPTTVIGVLRDDFVFPGARVELLRAMSLDPTSPGGRASHGISMIARLAPGLELAAARARTDALVARWGQVYPDRHGPSAGHPVTLTGVRDAMAGRARLPLLVVFGAVVVVLLVACLNVANLLLARGEDRRRELGVRVALGAGSGALIQQLLVESALLAFAGSVAGLAAAALGIRTLASLGAAVLPPGTEVRIDAGVTLFTVGVAALTTLAIGLAPAVAAIRGGTSLAAARVTIGRGALRFRRTVVVAQVAAAVALVAAASVLARGFTRLVAVDPGFDPRNTLTLDFSLPASDYPEVADVSGFHDELARALQPLPGVQAVGAIRTAPMSAGGGLETISVPGRPAVEGDAPAFGYTVQYQVADPGTFEAFGVPLLAGRAFTAQDEAAAPLATIVNASAARALFEDEEPLGRFLQMGNYPGNNNPLLTVVGVVGDVRQSGLDRDPPPQMYVPRAQSGSVYSGLGSRFATLAVRTEGAPEQAATLVRDALHRLDPGLPAASVMTLEARVRGSVGDRRFVVVLMAAFALVTVALGSVGLYGLTAYVVSARTREIGIRVALGARGRSVLLSVLIEAAALVGVGAALGVLLVAVAAAPLDALLYEVGGRDPAALLAAPALLLVTALLAAYGPARRALRIPPTEALRSD